MRSELNVAILSEFVWTLQSLVWVVFNNFLLINTTDKSKTTSDQSAFFAVSLYPLSFFANTPIKPLFKFKKISAFFFVLFVLFDFLVLFGSFWLFPVISVVFFLVISGYFWLCWLVLVNILFWFLNENKFWVFKLQIIT